MGFFSERRKNYIIALIYGMSIFSARIVETLGSENFGAITFAVIFQVSISSTFFACFFRRYFGAKNYNAETFGFVIFLVPKYRRKKAREKTLMKLTPDDKNESFRQNSEDLKVCTGQEVLVKYEQEGLVPFVGKK